MALLDDLSHPSWLPGRHAITSALGRVCQRGCQRMQSQISTFIFDLDRPPVRQLDQDLDEMELNRHLRLFQCQPHLFATLDFTCTLSTALDAHSLRHSSPAAPNAPWATAMLAMTVTRARSSANKAPPVGPA